MFNIYVNNIPSPRNCQTRLCLFVDDTTIMSTGASNKIMEDLNCYLDQLTQSDGAIGIYIPICNEDGTYAPMQCDVCQGHSWCSDEKGNNVSEPIQGSPQYEGLC
ncbi:hypothetical protein AVEN_21104-1 [Araneus ventricosus]|uniref:Thyroglobulin type-1 domain-containing protein n=1 Tax=Araneus ventricosus TaxID=182803 RepID=A0A4Y2FP07_ARAVE|nr:hypothetical protein AVEN_21104-1 [Araneus ventricosus]